VRKAGVSEGIETGEGGREIRDRERERRGRKITLTCDYWGEYICIHVHITCMKREGGIEGVWPVKT
jgi:hypothetical protein